jgi:hypothetical protein
MLLQKYQQMHADLPIHFVVRRIDPTFENLDRDITDIGIGRVSGAIDKSFASQMTSMSSLFSSSGIPS